jgi:hypothetical protein
MEGLLQHEARHQGQPRLVMATTHHRYHNGAVSSNRHGRVESGLSLGTAAIKKTGTTTSGDTTNMMMMQKAMGRSKTFFSLRTSEESLASSSTGSSSCTTEESSSSPRGGGDHHPHHVVLHRPHQFNCPPPGSSPSAFRTDLLRVVRDFSSGDNNDTMGTESFTLLRQAIEPHLRQARLARERARPVHHHNNNNTASTSMSSMIIGSTLGVPYPALRAERRFLYCPHSFPLHEVLASVLGLEDLARAHLVDESDLLLPLLRREQRVRFQAVYDSFVLSVCLPMLHSMALSAQIFQYHHHDGEDNNHNNERVTYRYQAFPTIHVSRPEQRSAPQLPCHEVPTCDTILGHGPGCLTFHVPLTPCGPANSLYTETRPGREDWHPLDTKAIGLGYLHDGARCLSFYLPNTSHQCAVALTFRVQIQMFPDDNASSHDVFSCSGPGYYEEAVVNLQPGSDAAISKACGEGRFLTPDHRNGYPFI